MVCRLCMTNANVIMYDTILENRAIVIKDGRIECIEKMEELGKIKPEDAVWEIIDCENAFLAPGFIDIHSDNIEVIAQPRPTSLIDFQIALMEQEKHLVNEGITTMYHSLSLVKKGSASSGKSVRQPDQMIILADLISRKAKGLIRHRFHCRFDIRNLSGHDALMDYIEKDYVHLLSFNDHSPGQGQYRNLEVYRKNQKNYNPDLSENEIEKLLQERMAQPAADTEKVRQIAKLAYSKGIPIASHDDDSEEKIEYVSSALMASISEFPVELGVAKKAKEKGMFTVAGAPNVLMGKSHSGNMSAVEGVMESCIDILCSDYYPSAMLHAVFKLNKDYRLPLWEAFRLTTLNPARALGIDKDFGSVEPGKVADLLIIKLINERPAIVKVLLDGKVVSQLNY